jgi:hypothetical protein
MSKDYLDGGIQSSIFINNDTLQSRHKREWYDIGFTYDMRRRMMRRMRMMRMMMMRRMMMMMSSMTCMMERHYKYNYHPMRRRALRITISHHHHHHIVSSCCSKMERYGEEVSEGEPHEKVGVSRDRRCGSKESLICTTSSTSSSSLHGKV